MVRQLLFLSMVQRRNFPNGLGNEGRGSSVRIIFSSGVIVVTESAAVQLLMAAQAASASVAKGRLEATFICRPYLAGAESCPLRTVARS